MAAEFGLSESFRLQDYAQFPPEMLLAPNRIHPSGSMCFPLSARRLFCPNYRNLTGTNFSSLALTFWFAVSVSCFFLQTWMGTVRFVLQLSHLATCSYLELGSHHWPLATTHLWIELLSYPYSSFVVLVAFQWGFCAPYWFAHVLVERGTICAMHVLDPFSGFHPGLFAVYPRWSGSVATRAKFCGNVHPSQFGGRVNLEKGARCLIEWFKQVAHIF